MENVTTVNKWTVECVNFAKINLGMVGQEGLSSHVLRENVQEQENPNQVRNIMKLKISAEKSNIKKNKCLTGLENEF